MNNQQTTFADWLHMATRGLPKNVLPLVQAELRAHYDDAVDDYVSYGKSQREAQDAALADLGDVDETAQALQQIHLAPRRYLLAAIACIAPLALIMTVLPFFMVVAKVGWIIVPLYPISLGSTCFALSSFSKLLPYHRLQLPLNMMFVGMSVSFVMVLLTTFSMWHFSVVERWAVMYFNETILSYSFLPAQGYNDLIVDGLIIGGVIITGLGSILFGRRMLNVNDPLNQIVGLIFMVSGILMLLHMTAVVVHNAAAASLFTPIMMIMMLMKYPASAMLFFRAARGGSAFPTRTA